MSKNTKRFENPYHDSDYRIFQKMLVDQSKISLEILPWICLMMGCHSYSGPNCNRCGKLLKEKKK